MTEYWVSQGNKWCDVCKIYISNNTLSIRTHELGQRHKDNVAKRLTTMRKDNVAKEKEQKETAQALKQIEAKAKQSYQKDLAALRNVRGSSSHAAESSQEDSHYAKAFSVSRDGWEYDDSSGYYFNEANGYYYDPKSRLYYSDTLGKWVAEAAAFPASSPQKEDSLPKSGAAPGLVISGTVNPTRSVKGAPSSIAVNKRKRQDGKHKVVSKEEAAALKAREAAKKRVEEREKSMLGLYRSY